MLGILAATAWGPRVPADEVRALQRWAHQLQALRGAATATSGTPGAPAPAAAGGLGVLSPRETEVLARMAAGDSNKLIARAFDLSPHTVKRHVANILDKLGLATRGQAAAWYRGQPH